MIRTEPLIVVMGVSAVGKSTTGTQIADRLGVPFQDADDLHPAANVEKMRAGTPLDDEDRWPWLDIVGRELQSAAASGLVIACSALRRAYRDRLRVQAPTTAFVHLHADDAVLTARAAGRTGHFMPPSLLASQLATLESLGDDELGVLVDVDASIEDIVDRAVAGLRAAGVTPA
ncbi:gluconokinase [Agromyces allii]|uniref:Gluconokinase n=1 Tax=Agromyces allii TaxID=393607 RepID=A0ABP5BDK8_9MICO|nr:gluconokinase [Agromyces allii]